MNYLELGSRFRLHAFLYILVLSIAMLNLGTVYGGNNMSLSNLSSSMTSDQDGFNSGPLNVTRENLPAFNMSSEKNALLNLTSNGVTETEGTESSLIGPRSTITGASESGISSQPQLNPPMRLCTSRDPLSGPLTGGVYDIYAKNARFDTIKFGDSNQVGFNIYLRNNLDDHRIDGSMDVSPNRGEGGYVTFGIRGIDTTCENKIGSNKPIITNEHFFDNPPLRGCETQESVNPVYHITGIANISNRQDIQASNSTGFTLTVRSDFTAKDPSLSADLGYPFYISDIDIQEIVTSCKTGAGMG